MKEWAQEHGKSVRQRSARQETTKKKAGTLPLSMYRRPQPILDDVHNDENEDGEANEIQSEEEEYEQEMEYENLKILMTRNLVRVRTMRSLMKVRNILMMNHRLFLSILDF